MNTIKLLELFLRFSCEFCRGHVVVEESPEGVPMLVTGLGGLEMILRRPPQGFHIHGDTCGGLVY